MNNTNVLERISREIAYWRQPSWPVEAVETYYDELAAHYDAINDNAHSYFRRFTDALRLAELPDNAHILDICARTGQGTAYFYEQGKVGRATCADVSREMGRRCTRRLDEIGFHNYRWVQIDGYSWPFDDGEFDVTLSLETIEHFARPALFIQELGRVTSAGGLLILSTPNVLWEPVHALAAVTRLHHSEGPHRFISFRRLRSFISRAGFQIEHAETNVLIPAGPAWLTAIGEQLEARMGRALMDTLGLRRLLICRKL